MTWQLLSCVITFESSVTSFLFCFVFADHPIKLSNEKPNTSDVMAELAVQAGDNNVDGRRVDSINMFLSVLVLTRFLVSPSSMRVCTPRQR